MKVTRDSKQSIPESLQRKLLGYRRRLWWLKTFEACAAALIGTLVGFLAVYVLDRLFDTPQIVRGIIYAAVVIGFAMIPLAIERWILRRRRFDQLARLLSRTRPSAGDQLLGVIELSEDSSEQARSPELVQAAINQVSEAVVKQDLNDAIPDPRHRQRAAIAVGLLLVAALLTVSTTAAAANAWARFSAPWNDTPRYTFAATKPIPESIVVPHGEQFDFSVALQESTEWEPSTAEVNFSGQAAQESPIQDREYRFKLPGQISAAQLAIKVGDFRGKTSIEPKLRPELVSLRAEVSLPPYLGRDELVVQDVRGSTMSVVAGSQATLVATASRALARASVNGQPKETDKDKFATGCIAIDEAAKVEMQWQDRFGLTGKEPFELTIQALDDQPPSLICENLPRRKVLLDREVLSFTIQAFDDFGVKLVGLEWNGLDPSVAEIAKGETVIGAGHSHAGKLDLTATFSAADADVKPQPISVRAFVEDYLPGRERVYSVESVFEVVSSGEHAEWINAELTRWQRMALESRDRELQLYETNKQLRALSTEELRKPENREKLVDQAQRERAGGRRLSSLVQNGEGLLQEAMRNPDISADHLESIAQMMQVLKDIAGNRMPSVSDLIAMAAQEPAEGEAGDAKPGSGRGVGQNRLTQQGGGDGKKSDPSDKKPEDTPSVSDVESSQITRKPSDPTESTKSDDQSAPRLGLVQTMLAGSGKTTVQPPPSDAMAEAVKEQEDLLAEFDKIADELNEVLANLEGSTLVKRLKSASRKQQDVAAKLTSLVSDSFGVSERKKEAKATAFQSISEIEATSSQDASLIMDDMDAFFQRNRQMKYSRILDQMRESDVTSELQQLAEELRRESGLSVSQAEYWSDTFDRWAEDLVEAAKAGSPPGGKSKGSLPPAIVLEVLQLLEAEVKLRDKTRVAQQSKPAVSEYVHRVTAHAIANNQDKLRKRLDKVVVQLTALPNGEEEFGEEVGLLSGVARIMSETTTILRTPETGPPAIAAETEIIELLLQSKRFNPSAGGAGGDTPGSKGGKGDTETAALALVGAGVNEKEVREALSATQSTGASGDGYPAEFRNGLDEYFNRLENWQSE